MADLVCYEMLKNFIPSKCCIKYRHDNEFTIVSNNRQEIYYLNESASFFYELCNGKNSINSIVSEMLAEYEVDEEEIRRDIIELIRNMQWQDIIEMKEELNGTAKE